ncbi:hypothetical protein D3C81_1976410 [compost metagenome]
MDALPVTSELSAIACRRGATGRPVIAAGGDNPVTGAGIVRPQQFGSDVEVGAGIKGIAGAGIAVWVVAQVGLSQPDINSLGVVMAERLPQRCTCLVAPGKAQR